MTKDEARIIRGRLGEYTTWEKLAKDADRKALLTQLEIEAAGDVKSPMGNHDGVRSQNPRDLGKIINELISDQQEHEDQALRCRWRMRTIEAFIQRNIKADKVGLFVARFIEGQSMEDMVPAFARSVTGISSIVDRELARVDFEKSKPLL